MVIPALLATALTACPQAPLEQTQQVEVRGLSTPRDMMLHGVVAGGSFQSNQGFTLNGSSIHANTGLLLNSRNIVLNGGQVSSTSAASCSDNSGMGFCLNGKPKFLAPIVVVPKPDVVALRAKYNKTPSTIIQGSLNLNSSSEIGSRFDNKIVQIKGSLNLNALATIKNATILVDETLNSNKGITLENSQILTKGVQLNQTTTLTGSRIISTEDLTTNGRLESTGVSSLISSKNLTTNQTVTSTTGELALIANQNITTNQSSTGKVAIWANGNVNLNQSSSLEGSVVAGGKVTLNQTLTLTKVLQHLNGDVLGGGSELPFGTRVVGTLGVNSKFATPWGVNIIAPNGSISSPVEVYVESVNPSTLSIALPPQYEAVGPYLRIGTTARDAISIQNIFIGFDFPIPAALASDRSLRVASLVPNNLRGDRFIGSPDFWSFQRDILRSGFITSSTTLLADPTGIFVLVRWKQAILETASRLSLQQEQPQEVFQNIPIYLNPEDMFFTCETAYRDCPGSVSDNFYNRLLQELRVVISDFELTEKPILRTDHQLVFYGNQFCTGDTEAYYDGIVGQIVICVNANWTNTANQNINHIIKHELTHAVQRRWVMVATAVKDDQGNIVKSADAVQKERSWIIEGTAVAAELSSKTTMKRQNARDYQIINYELNKGDAYKVQDFWVFVGNWLGSGLPYLKNIFRTGLKTPINDVHRGLIASGFPDGLKKAYYLWAIKQGFEKNNTNFNTFPFSCYLAASRRTTQTIELSEWNRNYSNVKVEQDSEVLADPVYLKPLQSRAAFVNFENPRNKYRVYKLQVISSISGSGDLYDTWYKIQPQRPPCANNTGDILVTNVKDKTVYMVIVSSTKDFRYLDTQPVARDLIQVKVTSVTPAISVPSGITLTGNVGDTLTDTIQVGNVGDVESTLKYKSYFVSSNEVITPQPFESPALDVFDPNADPTPNAGATARNAPIIRPYPDEGTLTPVVGNFLSPLSSSEAELTKTTTNLTPSREIPVTYFCRTQGTFTGLVNIVYRTGATDDLGQPIEEKQVVSVTVECKNPITTEGDGLGGSGGEPWLRMFDGEFIGFHALGEFTLAQNSSSGMNVQVRYVKGTSAEIAEPDRLNEVSFNGAVAMKVGSDRVGVYAVKGRNVCWVNGGCVPNYPNQAQVRLNGQIISPPNDAISNNYAQVLPSGGVLSWYGYTVAIISPDRQEIVRVRLFDGHVGSVSVQVPGDQQGKYQGLLGNFDDDPNNDYQTRGGATFDPPLSTEQLYLEWGESWRINAIESLFDYEDGQSTFSFTDRSYPPRIIRLESLSPQARALGESACRANNILDPRAFRACVLDVGITGNTGWANVAKDLDPNSKRLLAAPLNATMVVGEQMTLNANLFGDFANRNLIWSSNAGQLQTIQGFDTQTRVQYIAPSQAGLYTITVRSAEDPNLTGSIVIQVNQAVSTITQRLAVGDQFNALLNTDGTVSTWGLDITNYSNTQNCSTRANPLVLGANQIQSLSAGSNYVVALRQGQIMAWGNLAYASAESSNTPKSPVLLSVTQDWVGVSAFQNPGRSESLISLKRDGSAWVWLRVYEGFYDYKLKPFLIQGVSDVIGLSNNLLLKRDGTVWMLDIVSNNEVYQIRAKQVEGLSDVVQVSSSLGYNQSGHALALTSNGTVFAWGANSGGQLGVGFTSTWENQPRVVVGLSNVKQVRTTLQNSLGITDDGLLWAWGWNTNSFPLPQTGSVLQPSPVLGLTGVQEIQGFQRHLLAVSSSGLLGWGTNSHLQVACTSAAQVLTPSAILGITW